MSDSGVEYVVAVAEGVEEEKDEVYSPSETLNAARDALIKAIKTIYDPRLYLALPARKAELNDLVVEASNVLTGLENLMGDTGNLWERK